MAKRADKTIKLYGEHLRYFARFVGVPVEDLHDHLTKDNLLNYTDSIENLAPSTRQLSLSILRRYYKLNGVVAFDELEVAVLTPRNYEEPDDKPLTLETLKKMMDLANARERAILTTLISTGMRAGELCAITPDDIDGDIIRIRPEITHQRGRTVYLHAEAREYLEVWLSMRDEHLQQRPNNSYYVRNQPGGVDNRLFCCSYSNLKRIWLKLYNRVDGERGRYHAKCTIHSCRKYFRTYAVGTMGLDLTEMLMGHEGYLTRAYRRIPQDEARDKYHQGEHVLYITRADERQTKGEIETLKRKQRAMEVLIGKLQEKMT